jgi:hypothetical protein
MSANRINGGSISGVSININDNFSVDDSGEVFLNAGILFVYDPDDQYYKLGYTGTVNGLVFVNGILVAFA